MIIHLHDLNAWYEQLKRGDHLSGFLAPSHLEHSDFSCDVEDAWMQQHGLKSVPAVDFRKDNNRYGIGLHAHLQGLGEEKYAIPKPLQLSDKGNAQGLERPENMRVLLYNEWDGTRVSETPYSFDGPARFLTRVSNTLLLFTQGLETLLQDTTTPLPETIWQLRPFVKHSSPKVFTEYRDGLIITLPSIPEDPRD